MYGNECVRGCIKPLTIKAGESEIFLKNSQLIQVKNYETVHVYTLKEEVINGQKKEQEPIPKKSICTLWIRANYK